MMLCFDVDSSSGWESGAVVIAGVLELFFPVSPAAFHVKYKLKREALCGNQIAAAELLELIRKQTAEIMPFLSFLFLSFFFRAQTLKWLKMKCDCRG